MKGWLIAIVAVLGAGCNAILGIGDVHGGPGGDGGPPDAATHDAPPGTRPTFAAPASIANPPPLLHPIVADINNDTHPDVVGAANTAPGTSKAVSLVSNGAGMLSAGPTITGHLTSMAYANSVAVADITHDGNADVVISNAEGQDITVVQGPAFTTATSYPSTKTGVGCAILQVSFTDFTGDGPSDVVGTSNCLSGIEIWSGIGDGRLNAAVDRTFTTAGVLQQYVVGDLNHDGHQDLVAVESHQLDVVLGTGGGSLAGNVPITTDTAFAMPLALADVDGDGNLDLVFVENDRDHIGVLRGNGNGTFRGIQESATPAGPASIAIADFDGDGKLDVAGTAPNAGTSIYVLRGNGDGTFAAAQLYDVGAQVIGDLVAIDLDGNQKPDLVTFQPALVLLNTTP